MTPANPAPAVPACYSDGKRQIDVHFVRNGEVYYQYWREGVERQSIFDSLARMPVADFAEAIKSHGLTRIVAGKLVKP